VLFELLNFSSLTSPQHRLRASATTVLVTSIPRKWLTYEALDGLYDVFPGGIRNIWINRNFDELNDKVQLRDSLAGKLEAAETSLIRNAKKKHIDKLKKAAKKSHKSQSKEERKRLEAESDAAALKMAGQPGLSSGNPHQAHTVGQIHWRAKFYVCWQVWLKLAPDISTMALNF
jgi:hypothetical protein